MSEAVYPNDWQERRLTGLANYHNGLAFKPADWSEDGVRIIRIEQLNNPEGDYDHFNGFFPDANAINDGDLIFSWSATLKVSIWRYGKAVLNQHLFKVVPKSGFDKSYLYFLLDFHMDALSAGSHGSTMKHIKRGELEKYSVRLPSQREQEKIAEVLATIDSAIEKTEALIAKYQQIKAGLMHDLFTCGVTADGKLRPPREQAPELYQETKIGWVPKEWGAPRIGDIFDIQLGKMLNKLAKTGKWMTPYLGNRAVQWDFVDCSAIEEMDFSPTEREKYSLIPGDLLVCEGGDVGRTAMWRGELEVCYFQKAIHRLRPKSNRALSTFMLRYMRFAKESGYFREFTSQSSIAHLTQEKLGAIPMLLPKPDEQYLIAERFDAIDRLIQNEQSNLSKLHQKKLGLMHDLLTGKVRAKIHGQENTI